MSQLTQSIESLLCLLPSGVISVTSSLFTWELVVGTESSTASSTMIMWIFPLIRRGILLSHRTIGVRDGGGGWGGGGS